MDDDTTQAFLGIARHDPVALEELVQASAENVGASGLDAKTYAMINLAALIALDAAPASYVWQVGMALDAGATADDVLGVLVAVAPTVGNARLVAAAPEIALALGIDLEQLEEDTPR